MSEEIKICTAEEVESLIYHIRGVQVMLGSDLAAIYGYSTKRFNEQIKNNIERFDEDFMFQLTEMEMQNLRSKISTSSWGGTRNYGKKTEKIYHCGSSSKDGGRKVSTITLVTDNAIYSPLIGQIVNNPQLVLN